MEDCISLEEYRNLDHVKKLITQYLLDDNAVKTMYEANKHAVTRNLRMQKEIPQIVAQQREHYLSMQHMNLPWKNVCRATPNWNGCWYCDAYGNGDCWEQGKKIRCCFCEQIKNERMCNHGCKTSRSQYQAGARRLWASYLAARCP